MHNDPSELLGVDVSVSVILPFYKRVDLLRRTLPLNIDLFEEQFRELVIVLDEPTQKKEVIALVEDVCCLPTVVLMHREDHPWRPPCRAINAGLRQAIGKYALIMSPESVLLLPPDYDITDAILMTGRTFVTGFVGHAYDYSKTTTLAFLENYEDIYEKFQPKDICGSILVSREEAFAVHGYDESRQRWGGDDNDFRLKLQQAGVVHVSDPKIKVMHFWSESAKREFPLEPVVGLKEPNYRFGLDGYEVVYDWRNE